MQFLFFFFFVINKECNMLDNFPTRWSGMTQGGDKNNNYYINLAQVLSRMFCFITYTKKKFCFFYFDLFLITIIDTIGIHKRFTLQ